MTPEAESISIPAASRGGKTVRTWRADAALAGNTVIWGTTFVLVQAALKDISPLVFLAIRFSIATLALALLFRGRAQFRLTRAGLLAGVCLFAGYLFQTVGLQFTTASKSAFITGLAVPLVPLLGSLVYLHRPRFFELAGAFCATAGMGLMTLQGETFRIGRGDLLTFFCAVAFAAHILVLGHYSGRISFESLSLMQVAASAVLALSTFWWVETPAIRLTPVVLLALGVTGLLATALAFTVQAWAQQHTTATRTAVIYSLEPVIAWITSFLVLGETLSHRAAAGAGLILAGILLVELKRVHST
ncbi:MAG TPA: DMT family transporter [Bryobacteraceae bacterium]|nr:DMT family transporter [Bryobacteraceae bacterium]